MADHSATRKWHTRRRWVVAVLLSLAVLVAGAGITYSVFHAQPPQFMLFDGNVPGTPGATAELEYAHSAGFDEVVNYSFINAPMHAENSYLALAQKLHVKIIVSLAELLGDTPTTAHSSVLDQAPGYLTVHPNFGTTNAQQTANFVRAFGNDPAVWGWYISDELPEQFGPPDGYNAWIGPLQRQYALVKSLSGKPTMGVFTNNPVSFYRNVDVGPRFQLGADYYPYPDNGSQTYGGQGAIPGIAQSVAQVAGPKSWFVVQAFSWSTEGGHSAFNFPVNSPAPPANWMAAVMENAMYNGVANIGVYMYSDAAQTPGQLARITAAVAAAKSYWRSQHPLNF